MQGLLCDFLDKIHAFPSCFKILKQETIQEKLIKRSNCHLEKKKQNKIQTHSLEKSKCFRLDCVK